MLASAARSLASQLMRKAGAGVDGDEERVRRRREEMERGEGERGGVRGEGCVLDRLLEHSRRNGGTLEPKFSTSNPTPYTLCPKPSTLNLKP